MAIVGSDLGSQLIQAMNTLNKNPYATSLDYNTLIETTMQAYFSSNFQIQFTWVAVDNKSNPDPMTSFICTVSYPSFTIGVPASITDWGVRLSNAIKSGILVPPAGFTLSPLTNWLTLPPISTSFSFSTNYIDAINFISNQIVNFIKSNGIVATLSGTHLTYTGSTTGFVIL